MMLDLMKTPVGEVITKAGADVFLRSLDFVGAQELADRVMPQTPEGMKKAMEGLPDQAKNIVTAMQQQVQQLQQQLQMAQLELKYKGSIEQGWMQTELAKERMKTDTQAHDAAVKSHTALVDTHTKAQASVVVAEINKAGDIYDTHAKAAHDLELAKHTLKQGETNS